MQSSFPVKYYFVENYPNRDSLKSEIAPEYLDELGKNKKTLFLHKNIVATHCFMLQHLWY